MPLLKIVTQPYKVVVKHMITLNGRKSSDDKFHEYDIPKDSIWYACKVIESTHHRPIVILFLLTIPHTIFLCDQGIADEILSMNCRIIRRTVIPAKEICKVFKHNHYSLI